MQATIQCLNDIIQVQTATPGRDVNKFLTQLLCEAFPGIAVKSGVSTDISGTRVRYTVDIPCPLDLLHSKLSTTVAELRAIGFDVAVEF